MTHRAVILFLGPPLAGRTSLAAQLGWAEEPRWSRRVGSIEVNWRGRQLEVDLGYRGALYVPPLATADWGYLPEPERFRAQWIDSVARADGVLFVVDSQPERHEANLAGLERLTDDLRFVGREPHEVPVTFALNKRDLPNRMPVPELVATLMWPCCDHVETSAPTGLGVEASIDRLLSLIDERRRAQRT